MFSLELEFLGKQDASRLPFGFLEKYAYSSDRRALLNPPSKGENEKKSKEANDIEMDPDNKDGNINIGEKVDLIEGSEEHTYYSLLQIENEIEQCYKQLNQLSNLKNKEAITSRNKEITAKLNELKMEFVKKMDHVIEGTVSGSMMLVLFLFYKISACCVKPLFDFPLLFSFASTLDCCKNNVLKICFLCGIWIFDRITESER